MAIRLKFIYYVNSSITSTANFQPDILFCKQVTLRNFSFYTNQCLVIFHCTDNVDSWTIWNKYFLVIPILIFMTVSVPLIIMMSFLNTNEIKSRFS